MNLKTIISIDTGGTFTDALIINPDGEKNVLKVLSNGSLRGVLLKKISNKEYLFEANWQVNKDIFEGYTCRFFGENIVAELKEISFEKKVITFKKDVILKLPITFEITAFEEAPVLVARLASSTKLSEDFPPIQMKLGTTKGTNALLERKGAKVCLIVSKGFKDICAIGTQQRPDIFGLHIPEPFLIHDSVIEINEYVNASGQILKSPSFDFSMDEKDKLLQADVVVISLINSYKNSKNEIYIKEYLEEIGIGNTILSSSISAKIKYLNRTQTTLIHAYLSPIIKKYIQNIQEKIGRLDLQIMQSSGGLESAENFLAKNSLLSGPAGGIKAVSILAKQYNENKLISFDMGGTSTDVSRYDSGFDYRFTDKLEDIEFDIPSIYIETVAAGGGSICDVIEGKLVVGPQSAGSNPGPACYGFGGPLTITDVNVLLNRFYYKKFNTPIQITAAQKALESVLDKLNLENNTKNRTKLLLSFLQIANEKMANAIQRISVQKGFDPSEYTLVSFGGSGGMHACAVAEILGIKKIITPKLAGIFSAYGIGNTRKEKLLEKQFLIPLSENMDFSKLFDKLLKESEEMEGTSNWIVKNKWIYVKIKNQSQNLAIPFSKNLNLQKEFENHYRQIFGFLPVNASLELESIKILLSENEKPWEQIQSTTTKQKPKISDEQKTLYQTDKIPVYFHEDLIPGDYFQGPAIIADTFATSFLNVSWKASIGTNNDTILQYQEIKKNQFEVLDLSANLELFKNRFMTIAQEMGDQLQRTSFSVNIKERLDFSCAILNQDGYLIANAPHIPVHLGSLGICARSILEDYKVLEGDIILTNHPKYGGSHLPDLTLLKAVFNEKGELIAYVINRAHHAEIGGLTPGSLPINARNLAEEGVVFLPTYIGKNGSFHWDKIEKMLVTNEYPSRAVFENIADLKAGVAALIYGEKMLQKLEKEHGLKSLHNIMSSLMKFSNDVLWKSLNQLNISNTNVEEYLDDGFKINLKLSKTQTTLIFDFSASSKVHPSNLNANKAIVFSAVMYVLRLLCSGHLPLNEGLLRNVEIILANSFLNPKFFDDPKMCPAVVGGNTEVSQRLVDTIIKALGISACGQGTMNNLVFGNDDFGYYETLCGGAGASEGYHGRNAVHLHMTNTRITDPEDMERNYPARVVKFEIRRNSGGIGKWNGGNGVVREIEFLENCSLSFLSQHRKEEPYGVEGGKNGKIGKQWLIRNNGQIEPIEGVAQCEMKKGDVIHIETPGGGAWGNAEDINK